MGLRALGGCIRVAAAMAAFSLGGGSVASGAGRVVVVGVDGLSPAGVVRAKTPVLHELMKAGASTLHARAVMPTVSSPNWASMIMGAGPEQHGVTSNDWRVDKFEIAPTARTAAGRFPTIFDELRRQRPSAKIGVFHDWDGFAFLFDPKSADKVVDGKGPVETMEAAIAYFKEAKPDLTFIHLDHVDDAGHEHGHGSAEYDKAVEEADRLIGLLLEAIKASGLEGESSVIVTSDHGGVGKKHGGATMAEIEIPWIVRGRGSPPAGSWRRR